MPTPSTPSFPISPCKQPFFAPFRPARAPLSGAIQGEIRGGGSGLSLPAVRTRTWAVTRPLRCLRCVKPNSFVPSPHQPSPSGSASATPPQGLSACVPVRQAEQAGGSDWETGGRRAGVHFLDSRFRGNDGLGMNPPLKHSRTCLGLPGQTGRTQTGGNDRLEALP